MIDRFGRIDVLVNNAGIGAAGAVEENSVAQAQSVLDINVLGVIRMTKAVLPHMRAQGGGRIINVSSVLGVAPQPFMAIYVASKHAIEGYSESLDHEVREHGIRVLLVQPAYTKTSFDTNAAQPDTPLPVYAERRRVFDEVMADAMKAGDDPAVVAKVIVTAATDAEAQTALHRRPARLTRHQGAPPRPRQALRQADPQEQPHARLIRGSPVQTESRGAIAALRTTPYRLLVLSIDVPLPGPAP